MGDVRSVSRGPLRVLIVDDEVKMCRALERAFTAPDLAGELGVPLETSSTGESGAALERLADAAFDVVITDLRLPGRDGIELLKAVKDRHPEVDVVLMTAYATVETAVEALRLGAFDYVIKPFRMEEMRHILRRIAERRALIRENLRLREEVEERWRNFRLIGEDPAFRRVLEMAAKVAPTDSSVLLLGESGTGKDLLAQEIHRLSPRAGGPFIKATCAAIPEGLLESDLFGHEKGAFTGATAAREGRFELADGGTIFLDEVGDMSLATQVKLLRVLQEKEFERVGSSVTRKVNIRVIAATNRDLEAALARGQFREDLYYRLNVVSIRLPALRERRSDLLPLIGYFLEKCRARSGKPIPSVPPLASGVGGMIEREALESLLQHSWPGNVRELENAIEHAVIMAEGGRIELHDLPAYLTRSRETAASVGVHPSECLEPRERHPERVDSGGTTRAVEPEQDREATQGLIPPSPPFIRGERGDDAFAMLAEAGLSLDEIEKRMILRALEKTGGNQTQAARMLGITRRTLGYRLDKHGIRLGD